MQEETETVATSQTDDFTSVELTEEDREVISFKERSEELFCSDSEGRIPTLYVYKENGDTNRFALVTRFKGAVSSFPDEYDVGMKYGGGRYKAVVVLNKTKNSKQVTRSWLFVVSDLIKPQALEQPQMNGFAPVVPVDPFQSIKATIELLKPYVVPMIPVVVGLLKGNKNDNFGEMQKLLSDSHSANMKLISETFTKSMAENARMVNELMREKVSFVNSISNDNDPEDESQGSNVLDMINNYLPLIQQFLPMLSGSMGQATAKTLQSVPAVKNIAGQIASDVSKLKQVINYLDNLPDFGTDKVDVLLKALNLVRPAIKKIPVKKAVK